MTPPSTTPDRLVAGRYRLHAHIGGGGMGAVWLASDELLGRQVAVKQVLPPAGTDPDAAEQQRKRALREGRIAARLSHPHAISVYDVALEDDQPWLVMEYLPSRSLAAVLSEDGVLQVDQVAQIGAQVADALAATHAAGIVHRDVKPANILIGRGGRVDGLVKITDFGISHASGDVTLTQTGQITGTPAFLAPEVAQGHEMTEASDVFSLGATLYTCLEGQPPFGMDDNALRLLHHVAVGEIRPPQRAGALTRSLMRMLAADPAERPSMGEIRDSLAKLAAGKSGDTTTVLMARTALGSGAPERARTSTVEAGLAGAAGAAAGAAAPEKPLPAVAQSARPEPARTLTTPVRDVSPATATPPPPPPPPPGRPRRRRGLWLVAAVALVAAVLAGLIAFWAIGLDEDPSSEAGSPSAPSSSAAPSTEPSTDPSTDPSEEETAPATGQPVDTTPADEPATTPEPDTDPLTAANVQDFLESYHQLVLEDPQAAYARTGPTLRNAIGSAEAYADYWGQYEDVRISDIRATDGSTTATATLELRRPGGERETGQHQFTFLVRDGQLILDSDYGV